MYPFFLKYIFSSQAETAEICSVSWGIFVLWLFFFLGENYEKYRKKRTSSVLCFLNPYAKLSILIMMHTAAFASTQAKHKIALVQTTLPFKVVC